MKSLIYYYCNICNKPSPYQDVNPGTLKTEMYGFSIINRETNDIYINNYIDTRRFLDVYEKNNNIWKEIKDYLNDKTIKITKTLIVIKNDRLTGNLEELIKEIYNEVDNRDVYILITYCNNISDENKGGIKSLLDNFLIKENIMRRPNYIFMNKFMFEKEIYERRLIENVFEKINE